MAVTRLMPGDHLCVPFSGSDTYLEVVCELARSGVAEGDKVLCYTAQFVPVAVAAMLEASGPPIQDAIDGKQLVIGSAYDAYLGYGVFHPEQMIIGWHDAMRQARHEGYPRLRIIADMTWAAGEFAGKESLTWYEAQLNRLFATGLAQGACLYDRSVFTTTQLQKYAASHLSTVEADAQADTEDSSQLRLAHTSVPRGLAVSGQADMNTRNALEAVLNGLSDDLPSDAPVIIDLSGLTFADAAAATALVRTARHVPGVRLVGASTHLANILTLLADAEGIPIRLEAR